MTVSRYFLVPTTLNDIDGVENAVCDSAHRIIHTFPARQMAVIECETVPSVGMELNIFEGVGKAVIKSHLDWWHTHPEKMPEWITPGGING